jgi:plastocyanin
VKRRISLTLASALSVVLAASACSAPGGSTSAARATGPAAASVDESVVPTAAVQATTEEAAEAPPGAISVTVDAGADRFYPDEIIAPAGTLTFFIVNQNPGALGTETHQMSIGPEVGGVSLAASEWVSPGTAIAFTVTGLEPGTYRYWCFINEHHLRGMIGTLTVTP